MNKCLNTRELSSSAGSYKRQTAVSSHDEPEAAACKSPPSLIRVQRLGTGFYVSEGMKE